MKGWARERQGPIKQVISKPNDKPAAGKRTRNLPLRVSLLCLSTALCVALLSAVFARRLGFLFAAPLPPVAAAVEGMCDSGIPGDPGVRGAVESSEDGDAGMALLLLLAMESDKVIVLDQKKQRKKVDKGYAIGSADTRCKVVWIGLVSLRCVAGSWSVDIWCG